MAHQPKPFYRSARNAWYVQLGKQQIKLCDGPKNHVTEKLAWAEFHKQMADRPASTKAHSPGNDTALTLAVLLDKFLDWCQKHRAARTYEGYRWHLQSFCNHLKSVTTFLALDLKPFHVHEWLDAHPDWGQTYRRNAIAAVQRPYAWAESMGYIAANPVRKINKPMPKRREQVITPEQFAEIVNSYKPSNPFRDVLEFCWETGARPQEVRRIEARHVDLENHRIKFPPEEAKGKQKWRIIMLTPRAEEIVARLLPNCREGCLFLNRKGRSWTTSAINCRFCRLKEKLGVKFALYSLRHGFATRKLEAGLDSITVAALMGHSDSSMLNRVYSHVSQHHEYLREQLVKSEK